jgi:hypothetical protein
LNGSGELNLQFRPITGEAKHIARGEQVPGKPPPIQERAIRAAKIFRPPLCPIKPDPKVLQSHRRVLAGGQYEITLRARANANLILGECASRSFADHFQGECSHLAYLTLSFRFKKTAMKATMAAAYPARILK